MTAYSSTSFHFIILNAHIYSLKQALAQLQMHESRHTREHEFINKQNSILQYA
jgi:thymidylate synthase